MPLSSVDVVCVFIRSSRSAAETAELLRAIVKRIDPDVPVFDLASMDSRVSESFKAKKMNQILSNDEIEETFL